MLDSELRSGLGIEELTHQAADVRVDLLHHSVVVVQGHHHLGGQLWKWQSG